MKKDIVLLVTFLLALSCQKEQVATGSLEGQKQFKLTVEATKGTPTKALSLEDNTGSGGTETLHAYWKNGEKVAVYCNGNHLGYLTATVNDNDRNKATLSGTLDSVSGLQDGSQLDLLFPRADWDYSVQTGAAPSEAGDMATLYDYALATVTVASVDDQSNTIVPASAASFVNQQNILRFTFEKEGAPFVLKNLQIGDSNNRLLLKREYKNNGWKNTYGSLYIEPETPTAAPIFVAFRSEDTYSGTQPYLFSAVDTENTLYVGSKSIPEQYRKANGVFASTTVSLSKYTIPVEEKTGTSVL